MPATCFSSMYAEYTLFNQVFCDKLKSFWGVACRETCGISGFTACMDAPFTTFGPNMYSQQLEPSIHDAEPTPASKTLLEPLHRKLPHTPCSQCRGFPELRGRKVQEPRSRLDTEGI